MLNFCYFDFHGLELMKTQNSVSHKVPQLHQMNLKRIYFYTEMYSYWQVCPWGVQYMHTTFDAWLVLLLHELLLFCRVVRSWAACGFAEVLRKPRLLYYQPSAYLHYWVWCLLCPLWQFFIDSLWGFGQSSFLANQLQCWYGDKSMYWYFVGRSIVLLEKEMFVSIQLACQQRKA